MAVGTNKNSDKGGSEMAIHLSTGAWHKMYQNREQHSEMVKAVGADLLLILQNAQAK